MSKSIQAWLAERYPVGPIREFYRAQAGKLLPAHTSWWHTIGSLLLFLTLNQIVTGILLMVYYRPAPETAFESIHHIMTRTDFGWLIRGLHAWGATAMIFLLIAHMLRTFVMGAFKKPRELTWVTGVVIFGVVLTFGFTGYLLPWNQVSYWATTVGTEVTGAIPGIGATLKTLLRGGDAVGGETLARFYVVHVSVLPWVLVFVVAVHIILIRVHGLAPLEPVGRESRLDEKRALRFFPDHVAKESVIFSIFFTILVAVVFLFPPDLGERVDAFRSPEGVKPEWYFLPTYQLLKYLPKVLGIFVSVVPFVLLLIWPFFDRSPQRHPRKRPWSILIGTVALVLALVFGTAGSLSERTTTLFGKRVHFDMYAVPHEVHATTNPAANPATIALAAGVEEGRKMVIATVTQAGKVVEKAKIAFSLQVESELRPLGSDVTLEDGTAAIRLPVDSPGGPGGELSIVAEIVQPEALAGAQGAAVFTGGIPVPAPGWGPKSLGSLLVVGLTLLAGILSAAFFHRLVKPRRSAVP